jgi:peptidoglycan/LPS O-acetylase OafA/YrhL
MSKHFKKFLKQNIHEVRRELARAHLIIALLSVAVIVLLSLGATQPVTFNPVMSAVCVVLLSVVAFISLCMSYTLYTCKK